MLRKIFALFKKDFLVEASYKFPFLLDIFGIFVTLLIYFFIDKLFGYRIAEHLEEFGVNYFSYVLLSMAFFGYIGIGITSFSSRIRNEQLQGTLESLFLAPTKLSIIILSMGMWNFILSTMNLFIYLILGIFVFKINFSGLNLLSTMVILILTIISFNSLGIISASFILVFKRNNPVYWTINTFEGILGGVYFPISVMPGFLQLLAKFLPITYAIRAIELAVYRGYSLGQLKNECLILSLFSLILTSLSFYFFRYALKECRRQGSLAQY